MAIFIKKNGALQSVGSSSIIEVEKPVELNIAYGNNVPSDTTKLWVKSDVPNKVMFNPNMSGGNEVVHSFIASLPNKMCNITSSVVGDKIYLFGGDTSSKSNKIRVFDTTTETLETLETTLAEATYSMGIASLGTKIYLFGGVSDNQQNMSSKIQVFNTTDNTITTLSTSLRSGVSAPGSAIVGDKIYIFGGYSGYRRYISYYSNAIQMFDTTNNTVTTLATTLPREASSYGTAVVGNKIYIFGGSLSTSPNVLDTINVFNTVDNTLITLATTLSEPISEMGIASIGTKIYLFGGYTRTSPYYLKKIQVFDTSNETLTALTSELPNTSRGISASVVGTNIYLFGGYTVVNGSVQYFNSINKFTVVMTIPENNLLLTSTGHPKEVSLIDNNSFKLVENIGDAYFGNSNNEGEQVKIALYENNEWEEIN